MNTQQEVGEHFEPSDFVLKQVALSTPCRCRSTMGYVDNIGGVRKVLCKGCHKAVAGLGGKADDAGRVVFPAGRQQGRTRITSEAAAIRKVLSGERIA